MKTENTGCGTVRPGFKNGAGAILTACLCVVLCGCGHTLPLVANRRFDACQTGRTLGIEYVFDVNQFNYAEDVKSEMAKKRCFQDIILTHDVADERCDAVVRGNFSYYVIDVHNNFYYASIYMLYIPLVTGLPSTRVEGVAMANFEVYRNGRLFKTYVYKDVFWGQTGWIPFYLAPGPAKEIRRLSRYLLKDIMRDLYGAK